VNRNKPHKIPGSSKKRRRTNTPKTNEYKEWSSGDEVGSLGDGGFKRRKLNPKERAVL